MNFEITKNDILTKGVKTEDGFHIRIKNLKETWGYNINDKIFLDDYEILKYIAKQEKTTDFLMDSNLKEKIKEILYEDFLDSNIKPAIFIEAPTGCGKTTFLIKEICNDINFGKVLYLTNRTALKLQIARLIIESKANISNELKKIEKNIDVLDYAVKHQLIENVKLATYQEIEQNDFFDFDEFDTVICDESHYFVADSEFNVETEKSLFTILENFKNKNKFFVTATPDDILPVIALHLSEIYKKNYFYNSYENEKTYALHYFKVVPHKNNFKVEFFNYHKEAGELFSQLINKVNFKEKTLIFLDNKEQGKKLVEFFKEKDISCDFIDSSAKDTEVFKNLILKNKFDSQILISTSVIDNGVSIIDKSVKNIVIISFDKISFLQKLGRKRLDENEKITIYIPNFDKKNLENILNGVIKNLQDYCQEQKNATEYLCKNFSNSQKSNFCYYNTKKDSIRINSLIFHKLMLKKVFLEDILNKYEDNSNIIVETQLNWLGVDVTNKKFLKYTQKEIELINELEKRKGKLIFETEIDEYLTEIKYLLNSYLGTDSTEVKSRENNRYTSVRANNRFEKYNLPFKFEKIDKNLVLVELSEIVKPE